MPHVPAPDAVREIRAAATANRAALISVADEIDHHLEHVDLFPNTPAKGRLRDGLVRLQARYRQSAKLNDSMILLAGTVLAMLDTNTAPDPDAPVAPTAWSTGNW